MSGFTLYSVVLLPKLKPHIQAAGNRFHINKIYLMGYSLMTKRRRAVNARVLALRGLTKRTGIIEVKIAGFMILFRHLCQNRESFIEDFQDSI